MNNSISSYWKAQDSKRWATLDRARTCSSLTKPWVLPPEGFNLDGNDRLDEPFSSLASRGISNLEGRLLLALYPPGRPFFSLRVSQAVAADPEIAPEQLQQFEQILFMQELAIQAALEASYVGDKAQNRRRTGFRSQKRAAISQLLVTGDVLEQLTDDYRIKVFRRDQYITKRDSSGDVLCHIVKEVMDPLSLSPQQLEMCNMNQIDLAAKPAADRLEDMYTQCEWNPLTKTWVIAQECNGHIILESEDPVSPFMATTYELAPGESYGRGLVELNLGDIRSVNELTQSLLDFSATASKQLFALDMNSQVMPEDLAKPSGSVIQARVQGGQVSDVGMIRADKMNDFQVTAGTRDSIRKDLATVMLMEAEATPRGERVTAFQVQRVASELEGALGGIFSQISDQQQVPLIERLMFQMKRDRKMPALPDETVQIETLTGVSALSREAEGGRLLQVLQIMSGMGPEAMGKVNQDVLIDLLMRQAGVFEPGLLKSPEQIAAEKEQQMQMMMAQQVGAKAVDVVGNAEQARMEAEVQDE